MARGNLGLWIQHLRDPVPATSEFRPSTYIDLGEKLGLWVPHKKVNYVRRPAPVTETHVSGNPWHLVRARFNPRLGN